MDIVGELHFRGDIRGEFGRAVAYTEKYGLVYSVAAEYDEAADLTTVYYAEAPR